jgi:hypothetical protein
VTRPVKILVGVAAVGALSAAVVLTRPGPGDPAPPPSRTAVGEPSKLAPPDATQLPSLAHEEADEPGSARADAGRPDAGPADTGSAAGATAADGHGPNDVVRSRDIEVKSTAATRPRFAPDWKNPKTLTFAGLRKYRREYKKNGDFSEQTVRELSGAAAVIKGAVMPIDPLPESGKMQRLWIANPMVVMAGCVFCNPPTLADIVYVQTLPGEPYSADRERLYRAVVIAEARGRLVLGPVKSKDGVEYMFGLELREIAD